MNEHALEHIADQTPQHPGHEPSPELKQALGSTEAPSSSQEFSPDTVQPLGGVALGTEGAPRAQSTETHDDVDPNALRRKLDHILHRGTTADLEALFDDGMDINQEDFEGRTTLMMMSAQGRKDAVEMALGRGADVNRVFMYHDRIPMTALDAARQSGNREIIDLLVAHNAKSGKELDVDQ